MSTDSNQLTPEAERLWEGIPAVDRTRILNNAWCASCARPTTIVRFSGRVEKGNLVLSGECERCGEPVGRLVEGD